MLETLARMRGRMALLISAAVIVIYFGFILLIAFNKPAMGTIVTPGLSTGILLGALVILATWLLTWFYAAWANRHVDDLVRRIRGGER